MKRLTEKLITTAVAAGLKSLFGDDEMYLRNLKYIVSTIKLGEEAEHHVGYKALAYFAIECTDLMTYYYDYPASFHDKWEESVNQILKKAGYFLEPKNHCEYCIFEI